MCLRPLLLAAGLAAACAVGPALAGPPKNLLFSFDGAINLDPSISTRNSSGVVGGFTIRGPLSTEGVNTAVLPDTCANPVLLIRSFNTTTNQLGGWFVAGIPGRSDDD